MTNPFHAALAVGAMLVALGACAGGPGGPAQTYALDPGAPPSLRAMRSEPGRTVSVSYVNVALPFAANGFVYQLPGERWEVDPYNRFLVSPADLFTGIARDWVRASGLFGGVGEPALGGGQDYRIDLDVTGLYADFRLPAGRAVVTIQARVFRRTAEGPVLAWQKTFSADQPIADRTPDALIRAWNGALRQVLSDLLRDLAPLAR